MLRGSQRLQVLRVDAALVLALVMNVVALRNDAVFTCVKEPVGGPMDTGFPDPGIPRRRRNVIPIPTPGLHIHGVGLRPARHPTAMTLDEALVLATHHTPRCASPRRPGRYLATPALTETRRVGRVQPLSPVVPVTVELWLAEQMPSGPIGLLRKQRSPPAPTQTESVLDTRLIPHRAVGSDFLRCHREAAHHKWYPATRTWLTLPPAVWEFLSRRSSSTAASNF